MRLLLLLFMYYYISCCLGLSVLVYCPRVASQGFYITNQHIVMRESIGNNNY